MENDAQEWKALIAKEYELTSLESHDRTREEVVNTIPKMVPWGEMYEEFKIAKVTLMSKVEECIFS